MTLLTIPELAVWCRTEIDYSDEFANKVIAAASLVVREAAGHPEWTRSTAPERARLIATQLAKRTYLNPDGVVRSGVGPLSEAVVEDFARTLELTPYEREQLQIIGGTAPKVGGDLFVYNFDSAPTTTERTIYIPDLAGTLLPMHEAGDVGAPD